MLGCQRDNIQMLEQMQIQVPKDTTFFGVNERKSHSFAVFFGMAEAQNHLRGVQPQLHLQTSNPPSGFLFGIYVYMKTDTRILQETEPTRNLMEEFCIQEKP